MNDIKDRLAATVKELKQERDELRLKLELAKMEVGDDWERVERKLHQLEAKAREVGGAAAEASHEVGAAAKLMGDEIREGFRQIARKL